MDKARVINTNKDTSMEAGEAKRLQCYIFKPIEHRLHRIQHNRQAKNQTRNDDATARCYKARSRKVSLSNFATVASYMDSLK